MTTPPDEDRPDYTHRMADDGGGGLDTPANIQDHIDLSFEDLATIFTDPASIPTSASVRPAGSFTDAHDAMTYLETGGLVATENSGANTIPIGFVYMLKEFDEVLEDWLFTVYIDEDTN